MATITLTRASPAPLAAVWDVLTDFAAYGRWMPLTAMAVDSGQPRVGWGFRALSGLGPARFADSMIVTRWDPPQEGSAEAGFSVVKTGRLVAGWAEVRLEAAGSGTEVVWAEELTLRPAPVGRAAEPLVGPASRRLFARALDAMLEEAHHRRGLA